MFSSADVVMLSDSEAKIDYGERHVLALQCNEMCWVVLPWLCEEDKLCVPDVWFSDDFIFSHERFCQLIGELCMIQDFHEYFTRRDFSDEIRVHGSSSLTDDDKSILCKVTDVFMEKLKYCGYV